MNALHSGTVLDEIFASIEAVAAASKPPPPDKSAAAAVAEPVAEPDSKTTGKRRRDDSAASLHSDSFHPDAPAPLAFANVAPSCEPLTFRWKTALIETLKSAKDGRLKASKFQRLVCRQAVAAGECPSADVAAEVFAKRLAKLVLAGVVLERERPGKDSTYCYLDSDAGGAASAPQ